MKRWAILLTGLLAVYLGTGFYIVEGNQKAVVRRFGRVLVFDSRQDIVLKGSGLHYDLPWPFSTIERINLNEIRTLSVGAPEVDDQEGNFLQSVDRTRQAQFLTGDKNILNLQINVQYRISQSGAYDYLFRSESPRRHLKLLVESTAADLVSRSGVDFVHPLGLDELRGMLTRKTRRLAEKHRLGIEVEEVTIGSVYPPVQVKAHFLDVSNARADKETYINSARAYAEQRVATAEADARQKIDEAEIYRQQIVGEARGAADSFEKMVQRFRLDEQQGIQSYAQARQMALRRQYIESMEAILNQVSGKVFLDSGKPVDLTFFRDPQE